MYNYLFFFFFNPFLTLLYSIKNSNKKILANIIFLFCGFYGQNLVFDGDYDIDRYITAFENYDISTSFIGLFTEDLSKIMSKILTYLVYLFTSSTSIYTMTFGLVFGFFYSRVILFLNTNIKFNHFFIYLLFIASVFIVGINEMNVFHWMTASQILSLALFFYFFNAKKNIAYTLIILSIIFHNSFVLILIPFFLYLLSVKFRISLNLIIVLYLFSFFNLKIIGIEDLSVFSNFIEFLNYDVYLSDSHLESLNDKKLLVQSFHSRYLLDSFTLISIILSIFILLHKKNNQNDNKFYFLKFCFIFSFFFNLIHDFPSINRFISYSNSLIYFGFLFFARSLNKSIITKLSFLLTVPLLFVIIVKLRVFLEFMSITTLVGNPVTSLFILGDSTLISFIKNLF